MREEKYKLKVSYVHTIMRFVAYVYQISVLSYDHKQLLVVSDGSTCHVNILNYIIACR